jgi:outer membrane protein OmpA-like peptidoglycan-associated protein
MEQAEIFVFIASFFLIALGFKEPKKTPIDPPLPRDLPPIKVFPESSKFKFSSGKAELSSDFKAYIHAQLEPEVLAITQQYDVDAIEVIGHTDGQEVGYLECHESSRKIRGNLDQKLEVVAYKNQNVSTLCPGSNTDLGLMRALAVVQELKKSKGEIAKLNFRAYSAGQSLLEDGTPAPVNKNDTPERRRIEIRFTKLGKTQKIQ